MDKERTGRATTVAEASRWKRERTGREVPGTTEGDECRGRMRMLAVTSELD